MHIAVERRAIHVLLISLTVSIGLPGQEVAAANCGSKTLPVGVLDQGFQPVEGLLAANLALKVQKQNVAVKSISPGSLRRLALLLDVSGSMVDENKWRLVQLIAKDVIKSAPPEVEISLGTFANKYELLVQYTRDRQLVREALDALTFGSLKARKGRYQTVIPDSLLGAVRENHAPSAGDIVFVVTDGVGIGKHRRRRDLQDELLRRGTRAYFFFLRSPWLFGGDIDAFELRDWAATSGGSIVDLNSSSPNSDSGFYLELNDENLRRLGGAISALYGSMFHFYKVEIQTPQAVQQKGGKLEAAVLDAKGQKNKTLRLLYPKRLLPCATSVTANLN